MWEKQQVGKWLLVFFSFKRQLGIGSLWYVVNRGGHLSYWPHVKFWYRRPHLKQKFEIHNFCQYADLTKLLVPRPPPFIGLFIQLSVFIFGILSAFCGVQTGKRSTHCVAKKISLLSQRNRGGGRVGGGGGGLSGNLINHSSSTTGGAPPPLHLPKFNVPPLRHCAKWMQTDAEIVG